MNSIISISILYNPDAGILKNLYSYKESVASMLIVDNSEIPDFAIHGILKNNFATMRIITNHGNLGIARALNQGLEYAISAGYKCALLMDQDSELYPEAVNRLMQCLESDENIFIAAPRRIDVNSDGKKMDGTRYRRRLTCATSGSLVRLKHIHTVGYHDEKMFIDLVDHEYCLRAVSKGLHIVIVNDALMRHRLGMMRKKKILWVDLYPTYHSALRRYYKARNSLYVWSKYGLKYPRYVFPAIVNFIIEYLEILLFEDEKLIKTRALLTGFWDCIRQRFGEKTDLFTKVSE